MRLKELKKMIAEEYSRYLKEQEDVAVDVQPDVDVDAMGPEMGDEMGEDDPEATLRIIYDMLADYFEGEDEEVEDMDDEAPMDDVEPAAPEADLEEFYPTKKATTTHSGKLGAAGYKPAKTTSGRTGFDGKKGKALQEVKRMQKLANIIKG